MRRLIFVMLAAVMIGCASDIDPTSCNEACGVGMECRLTRYGPACCYPPRTDHLCHKPVCQANFYPEPSGLAFCEQDGSCCIVR